MTDYNQSDKTKERLASLEAVIQYHSNALEEISNTLKEVVKTQAMLANQREEITNITSGLSWASDLLHNHDKELSNRAIAIDVLHKDVDELKETNKELQDQVKANARFIKTVSAIGLAIVAPSAATILAILFL